MCFSGSGWFKTCCSGFGWDTVCFSGLGCGVFSVFFLVFGLWETGSTYFSGALVNGVGL